MKSHIKIYLYVDILLLVVIYEDAVVAVENLESFLNKPSGYVRVVKPRR